MTIRAAILSFFCLALSAFCVAEETDSVLDMLLPKPDDSNYADADEIEKEALPDVSSLNSPDRMFAAYMLGRIKTPRAESALQELIADADTCVRRVAAEALHGKQALTAESAAKYGYVEILAAEAKAHTIFETIANGDPKQSYAATRELLDLKHNAAWAISQAIRDRNKLRVALSAAFVRQQIGGKDNIEPAWATEIRQKLNQHVTFDYKEMALSDVLKKLTELLKVDFEIVEKPGDDSHELANREINLQISDMKASLALDWITRLAECRYNIHNKRVRIEPPLNFFSCGPRIYLIDIRDLKAAGVNPPAWNVQIQKALPDYPLDNVMTTIQEREGFLILGTEFSPKPVIEYLDGLRKEHLPPAKK